MSSAPSTPAQPQTAAPPYPAALTLAGPAWRSPLAHGAQVPLVYPEIHIGQMEANDIVLADMAASRLHAVIRWAPDGYVIQDLGSTSGTLVQGLRLTGPTVLTPGQHIRIGNTDLLFQAAEIHQGAPPAAIAAPTATAVQAVATMGVPAAPVTAIPAQAVARVSSQAMQSAFSTWLQKQKPKHYWQVFVAGIAGYIVARIVLNATNNTNLVPLTILLGAALVPVTFALFCWEEGAFVDMPPVMVGLAFVAGGVIGLILAVVLESVVLGSASGLLFGILVGLCEEGAKGAVGSLFLRDKRLTSEIDGLVVGATVGMGFAAFETAGYGFTQFLKGFVAGGVINFQAGVQTMTSNLDLRMALAIFGHGTWTAIVCAAIWRERAGSTFRLTQGVGIAFAISVLLHALWDTVPNLVNSEGALLGLLVLVGLAGLFVLSFFIRESLERAKLGVAAPPPPPLGQALLNYLTHAFQSTRPRSGATAAAFAGAPQPYPTTPTAPQPYPTTPTAPQTFTATPPTFTAPHGGLPAAVAPSAPAPPAASPGAPSFPATPPIVQATVATTQATAASVPLPTATPPTTPVIPADTDTGGTASSAPDPSATTSMGTDGSAPPLTPATGTGTIGVAPGTTATGPAGVPENVATPSPTPGATVYCPRCGGSVPAAAKFCSHCGNALTPAQ